MIGRGTSSSGAGSAIGSSEGSTQANDCRTQGNADKTLLATWHQTMPSNFNNWPVTMDCMPHFPLPKAIAILFSVKCACKLTAFDRWFNPNKLLSFVKPTYHITFPGSGIRLHFACFTKWQETTSNSGPAFSTPIILFDFHLFKNRITERMKSSNPELLWWFQMSKQTDSQLMQVKSFYSTAGWKPRFLRISLWISLCKIIAKLADCVFHPTFCGSGLMIDHSFPNILGKVAQAINGNEGNHTLRVQVVTGHGIISKGGSVLSKECDVAVTQSHPITAKITHQAVYTWHDAIHTQPLDWPWSSHSVWGALLIQNLNMAARFFFRIVSNWDLNFNRLLFFFRLARVNHFPSSR